MIDKPVMGLAEAAHRLLRPYQDCHRLLLTGVLRGEKRKGRWYVLEEDVEQLLRDGAVDGPASTVRGRDSA